MESIKPNKGINREKFFQNMKDVGLFSKYTQLQVDSIDAILDEMELLGVDDKRQMAYIFATAYHEGFDYDGKTTGTIQRLVPIREKGGESYLRRKAYYPYVGVGFVMLTWIDNYKEFNRIISRIPRFKGKDIVKYPKQLEEVELSAFVLVYGMINGTYTKKKLSDYFNAKKTDPINARRIVNGIDKAKKIASYYHKFYLALN